MKRQDILILYSVHYQLNYGRLEIKNDVFNELFSVLYIMALFPIQLYISNIFQATFAF